MMENLEKQTAVNISVNMDNFEGVTAHMFQINTLGSESRLDCVYVDNMAVASGAEEVVGKVVARVNMSTERLRELYDLLGKHFGEMGLI